MGTGLALSVHDWIAFRRWQGLGPLGGLSTCCRSISRKLLYRVGILEFRTENEMGK